MGAYYSVIRYMPDVNTGEFLNAGVLVFGETSVRARFVRDWGRLRRFGDGDISFLKQLAKDVEDLSGTLFEGDRLTPDKIKQMAASWVHCIRLTPPSYALMEVDSLLEFAANRFLPSPRPSKPKPRTRAGAVKVAADALNNALKARGGRMALDHLQRKESITGKHGSHEFPLVLKNGSPRLAIDAYSFEIIEGKVRAKKDIQSAAYAIRDIRAVATEIGSAVVVLEPAFDIELYHYAVDIFQAEGSKVVTEDEVDGWAEEVAAQVLH